MNEWSKRTLHLVDEEDYLDRLQQAYPHEEGERDISQKVLSSIRQSFVQRDDLALLDKLLNLKKFPYKDSYVAFLRKDRAAIDRNPQTVRRICGRLYDMGIDDLIEGVKQPKEANARRGNQFRDWAKRNFKWVNVDEFRSSRQGIVMLDATEAEARDFCNTEMGVGISKRPDIVVKSGRRYVIGEAKFLSATGGNQGRGFDDGMKLANNTSGNAFKIFVLDGIHWIERGSSQYKMIEYGTAAIFSVLLLHDFLNNVPQ
jgi:hypothetical protein